MSRSPLGGGFSNRSLSHPKGKNGETLLYMNPIGTASVQQRRVPCNAAEVKSKAAFGD